MNFSVPAERKPGIEIILLLRVLNPIFASRKNIGWKRNVGAGKKGSIENLRRFHGSPIYGDDDEAKRGEAQEETQGKLFTSIHRFISSIYLSYLCRTTAYLNNT